MQRLKLFVEQHAFGVCAYIGERMGIATSHIRLFFIYATFISPASPIIVYMVLAFWLNMKKYMQSGRKFFVD